MEWYLYPAVVGIGFLAGFLNTLAGGGSALSLPFLIFLGLPVNVANGTNRIAILLQNAVASVGFAKEKMLDFKKSYLLLSASVPGAILGAVIAIHLNENLMRRMVGAVLIVILLLVIFKPDLWLNPKPAIGEKRNSFVSFLIFFLIGAYGGFIQIGTGFFLLTGLVLVEKFNLTRANALKVFLTLVYTPLALFVFILNKQVDYQWGIILAIGNMLGAWVGSKVAVSWGPKFIRWILIAALFISSLKLFKVF
jgi:uncharacterized membrane protein YfcA